MGNIMKTLFLAACMGAASATAQSVHPEEHLHEHHHHGEQCQHGEPEPQKDWLEKFDADVSLYIDTFFYHEGSEEGLSHVKEEISGFRHGHEGGDEHEDDHGHGYDNGFNLREVELQVSGEVDGYLMAVATLAFTEENVEIETAEIETTSLPWGLRINAGKLYSDFGIINNQHTHDLDFSDRPLIYELMFGDHGLNDVGAQVSWKLPDPFFLRAGIEAFEGDQDKMFTVEDNDALPDHNGPKLGVGWLKFGPSPGDQHRLQFGLFGGGGIHQEIHEEGVGTNNYLDGMSYFLGADALYEYRAHKENGHGDFSLQGEYFYRNQNLDLLASDDPGAPLDEQLDSNQDGFYVQMLYGLLPRWRTGLRWDQVGLTNDMQEPGEMKEQFGDSYRVSAMVDFSPSPSSLIRFQLSNGEYDTPEGTENVWEAFVQLTVSLGSHHDHESHHH